MPIFKTIKQFILDIIFPIACLGCQREGVWLCQACADKIPLKNEYLQLQNNSSLNGLIVAATYENEIIQESIHILKYKYVEDLAKPLGQMLAKTMTSLDKKHRLSILERSEQTLLLPVPLHRKRFLERGFNQSELIAKEFNQHFNFQLKTNILKRQKHTMPQVKLKGKERKENVKNAFVVKNWNFTAKNVIILDDVATTLSTLEECAKVLKQAGAYKVWGLVVARDG
jgi:ComF family protein